MFGTPRAVKTRRGAILHLISCKGETAMHNKKPVSVLPTLCLLVGLLLWTAPSARAAETSIADRDNVTTPLEWSGSYTVNDNVTISGKSPLAYLTGDTTITIAEGKTLTVAGRINFLNGAHTLTIKGKGNLVIGTESLNSAAIIGTNSSLVVDGAQVTAINSCPSAAIALCAGWSDTGQITVKNGSLTVTNCSGRCTGIYGKVLLHSGALSISFPNSTGMNFDNSYGVTFGNVTINNGKYYKDESGNYYGGTLTSVQGNALKNVALTLAPGMQAVTVTEPFNGTVAVTGTHTTISDAPQTIAQQGETITLTATPAEGCVFGAWTFKTGSSTTSPGSADSECDFTMPAADVTVSASFLRTTSYVDASGKEHSLACTELTADYIGSLESSNGVKKLPGGWYVVTDDLTCSAALTTGYNDTNKQHVAIILCNGKTLTCTAIAAKPLTIYGQSLDPAVAGTLRCSKSLNATDHHYSQYSGNVVIATDQKSGLYAGNVTLHGGTLTVSTTNTASDARAIFSSGLITINGGQLVATADGNAFGLYVGNTERNIVLGWTNPTDSIQMSRCRLNTGGFVTVKSGQVLTDGENVYSGTLTDAQVAALAGKTLRPARFSVAGSFADGTGRLEADVTATIGGTLAAAAYEGGRLKEIRLVAVSALDTAQTVDTGLTRTAGYTYKLFLLHKTTRAPLCGVWSE